MAGTKQDFCAELCFPALHRKGGLKTKRFYSTLLFAAIVYINNFNNRSFVSQDYYGNCERVPMKILIVGLGSIGRRHLKNLKEIKPSWDVAVLRHQQSAESQFEVINKFAARLFYNIDDALQWIPDAVVIANPAPMHLEVAFRFADGGSHLFIEKPIAIKIDGIEELIKKCREKNLVLMIGYMLRFFEPLCIVRNALEEGRIGSIHSIQISTGQYLPDWRPGQDYRTGVSARSDLGGGVIFELSHEIDYARWLGGEVSSVTAVSGRVSSLDIETEDNADIILRFKNGGIANIHVDMVDHATHRICRVVGSKGTIVWSSEEGDRVKIFSMGEKEWIDLRPASPVERNSIFIEEMRHFFYCIRSGSSPVVTGRDGLRVLEIALAAHRSSKEAVTVLL